MSTEKQLAESLKTPLSFHQTEINGHTINYVTGGSGPSLLLIHGGNIGWGQWYPNIDALAQHFTIYAIDLPGGGRSSRVDFAKLDFERDMVDVVEKFIQKENLSDLSIMGTSNGGWVAMSIALRNPTKIKKILVANSVGFSDYAGVPDKILSFYPLAKMLSRTVFRPIRSNKRLEMLLRGVFHDQKTPVRQEFIEYFYETMATSHNLLFISQLVSSERRKTTLLSDRLSEITAETCIVWGEDDKLMPIDKHSPAFSKIPHVEMKRIKNAGHMPSIEQADEFNVIALEFLTR